MHPPPMGPPGGYGSHKDIKLTLLNKVNGEGVVTVMQLRRSVRWLNDFFIPLWLAANRQGQ